MDKMSDKLKEYFDSTPRVEVLKEWEEIKEQCKDIESPTVVEFIQSLSSKTTI